MNRAIRRHFIHDAKVRQALADLRTTFDRMEKIEAKAFDIIRNPERAAHWQDIDPQAGDYVPGVSALVMRGK